MAELMGDPRDPDAHDGAPSAADDAPTLLLETAPVDTSAVVGGDAAAAREAAAHCVKGVGHLPSPESEEDSVVPGRASTRTAYDSLLLASGQTK